MGQAGVEPERTYDFPVYATQGGGLVREVAPNIFEFVEKPHCSGLEVGDTMPKEWSIIPANDAARRVLDEEQFGNPDDDLFDLALAEYIHRGPKARQSQ